MELTGHGANLGPLQPYRCAKSAPQWPDLHTLFYLTGVVLPLPSRAAFRLLLHRTSATRETTLIMLEQEAAIAGTDLPVTVRRRKFPAGMIPFPKMRNRDASDI
jgi:hypothetical protein